MIPFSIDCDKMEGSNLTRILGEKFMKEDKDTFLKIMNYEPYEPDEKLDNAVSLCSLGGDVFSEKDNFSLCSVSSEEDTSDDDSNVVERLASDNIFAEKSIMDMPLQRRNSTGRIIPKIDIIRPEIYSTQHFKNRDNQEIPYFAPLTANNAVAMPQSHHGSFFRPQNNINAGNQFHKNTFDELLINLEISMRRTEMTRSAVMKQANSFYGNDTPTMSRATSPSHNGLPVCKKRKSI